MVLQPKSNLRCSPTHRLVNCAWRLPRLPRPGRGPGYSFCHPDRSGGIVAGLKRGHGRWNHLPVSASVTPNGERDLLFASLVVTPRPSFRTEQADFFFPFHSRERVGLRREKSLCVFLPPTPLKRQNCHSEGIRQGCPKNLNFKPFDHLMFGCLSRAIEDWQGPSACVSASYFSSIFAQSAPVYPDPARASRTPPPNYSFQLSGNASTRSARRTARISASPYLFTT